MVEENNSQTIKPEDSFVLARFSGAGSAEFGVIANNVNPYQVLALAVYLEMRAKNEILMLEQVRLQQEQMSKIQVPASGFNPKGIK